jgi:hypothetical protein
MGGVFNYVNLHVYHYAGNNPVVLIDPDGRDEKKGPLYYYKYVSQSMSIAPGFTGGAEGGTAMLRYGDLFVKIGNDIYYGKIGGSAGTGLRVIRDAAAIRDLGKFFDRAVQFGEKMGTAGKVLDGAMFLFYLSDNDIKAASEVLGENAGGSLGAAGGAALTAFLIKMVGVSHPGSATLLLIGGTMGGGILGGEVGEKELSKLFEMAMKVILSTEVVPSTREEINRKVSASFVSATNERTR